MANVYARQKLKVMRGRGFKIILHSVDYTFLCSLILVYENKIYRSILDLRNALLATEFTGASENKERYDTSVYHAQTFLSTVHG